MPPALVASTPPIWQLPSDAKLNGNRRPALAATACALASTRPASTVMVLPSRSMSRTWVMRLRLTTTSLPLSNGI